MQLSRPTQRAASIARGRTMAASRCCRRVPPFVSNRNTLIGRVQRAALLPRFKTAIRASTAFTDEKQKSQNHSPTNFKNLKSPPKIFKSFTYRAAHTHKKRNAFVRSENSNFLGLVRAAAAEGLSWQSHHPQRPARHPLLTAFLYIRPREEGRSRAARLLPSTQREMAASVRQTKSKSIIFHFHISTTCRDQSFFFCSFKRRALPAVNLR